MNDVLQVRRSLKGELKQIKFAEKILYIIKECPTHLTTSNIIECLTDHLNKYDITMEMFTSNSQWITQFHHEHLVSSWDWMGNCIFRDDKTHARITLKNSVTGIAARSIDIKEAQKKIATALFHQLLLTNFFDFSPKMISSFHTICEYDANEHIIFVVTIEDTLMTFNAEALS